MFEKKTNVQVNDTSGLPVDDGCMSLFLGSSSSSLYRKTCIKSSDCTGHF